MTQETLSQQKYVRESLQRAFDELRECERNGRKLQTADDFLRELEAEEV